MIEMLTYHGTWTPLNSRLAKVGADYIRSEDMLIRIDGSVISLYHIDGTRNKELDKAIDAQIIWEDLSV